MLSCLVGPHLLSNSQVVVLVAQTWFVLLCKGLVPLKLISLFILLHLIAYSCFCISAYTRTRYIEVFIISALFSVQSSSQLVMLSNLDLDYFFKGNQCSLQDRSVQIT